MYSQGYGGFPPYYGHPGYGYVPQGPQGYIDPNADNQDDDNVEYEAQPVLTSPAPTKVAELKSNSGSKAEKSFGLASSTSDSSASLSATTAAIGAMSLGPRAPFEKSVAEESAPPTTKTVIDMPSVAPNAPAAVTQSKPVGQPSAPVQPAPAQPAPAQLAPAQVAPAQVAPAQVAPAQVAPAQVARAQSAPFGLAKPEPAPFPSVPLVNKEPVSVPFEEKSNADLKNSHDAAPTSALRSDQGRQGRGSDQRGSDQRGSGRSRGGRGRGGRERGHGRGTGSSVSKNENQNKPSLHTLFGSLV